MLMCSPLCHAKMMLWPRQDQYFEVWHGTTNIAIGEDSSDRLQLRNQALGRPSVISVRQSPRAGRIVVASLEGSWTHESAARVCRRRGAPLQYRSEGWTAGGAGKWQRPSITIRIVS